MAARIKLDKKITKEVGTYVQEVRKIINRDATIYAVIPEEIERLLEDVKLEVIKLWEERDKRFKAVKSPGLSISKKAIMVNEEFYNDVKKWKITRRTAITISNKIAKLLLTRFQGPQAVVSLVDYRDFGNGQHYFVLLGDGKLNVYGSIGSAWTYIRNNLHKEVFKSATKNLIDNTFNQLLATIKYSDIGHERSAAEVASDKLYHAIEASEPELAPKFLEYKNRVTEVGLQYSLDYGFNKLLVDLAKNTIKGKYITALKLESRIGNLRETVALKNAMNAFIKEVEKYLVKDLIIATHSKSILRTLFDDVISIFKGKKTKPLKKGKSIKSTKKRIRAKIYSGKALVNKVILKPKLAQLKVATKQLYDAVSDTEPNFNKRIPALNARLHDKIQQNMGKGGSKQKLNYRTGRFARSAEIKEFFPSREKNAIDAKVKYMKDPYSIFEPGGKLHKGLTGRDPHLIFGKSIRQLLQEEKIANLRRVKVELTG